jgi:hypothetical protein
MAAINKQAAEANRNYSGAGKSPAEMSGMSQKEAEAFAREMQKQYGGK